ncbi:MAG: PucR family transcriptional regulator [Desulfitobacterium sp.]
MGRLFLYKTAILLYFELAKAQSVEDTERQHYRDFLFDLLYNNFDSLEVVQSRGKLWGMDLTKPHMVIVGEIPGYDPDSADRVAFQELLDTVAMILRNQPRTIFLERNDQIVLLYPLEGMMPLSQWEATTKRLLSPLMTLPGGHHEERSMMFGVGNLYDSTRFIHRSFQEAKSALELGQLFNLQERVVLFQDLGVMRLLLKLEQQELEDFRNEVLGPLLKFDQENNLHLEETLLASKGGF